MPWRRILCLICLTALGCGENKDEPKATPTATAETPPSASDETPAAPSVAPESPKVTAARNASLQLAETLTLELEGFVSGLPQTPRVAETTKRLKYAAAYTMGKRRSPWRAIQAKDFIALEKEMAAELAAQDPKASALSAPLDERLKAAVKLTTSADAFERSAAYELIDRSLRNLPNVDHRPYFIAHVPPYELAELAEERFHQIEPLAQRPFARILPFLWRVALDDENDAVRSKALAGLERWIVEHPEAGKPDLIRAINAKWTDPVTQGSLFSLAGLVKIPEVLEWCRNALDGQGNARSCRVGLARLGSPEAFDVLHQWVVKRSEDKRLQGPNNYGFREDFVHLAPYADLPFAKARYYALFDKVLGQVRRSGFATGMIARRSVFLEDAPRALEILRRHHAHYVKIWSGLKMKPDRTFLLDEFPKAIAAFEARVSGPTDAPPATK